MQRERDIETVALFNQAAVRSATTRRHWSPSSQVYASADALLDRLVDHWNINPIVGCAQYWYGAGRHVAVYYFDLTKGNQVVTMPVLGNPILRRLIAHDQLSVVLVDGDKISLFEDLVLPRDFCRAELATIADTLL